MKRNIVIEVFTVIFIIVFSSLSYKMVLADTIEKKVMGKVEEQNKKIYLTFDDGPTKVTEKILDVLDEFKIKATFFVVGKNVEKNPEILKRVFASGHTVGIHSYSHEYKKIYLSPEALKTDINRCLSAIKGVDSKFTPKFYRFPGGSFNLSETIKEVPMAMGLKYIDWNASCRDSEIKPEKYTELVECAVETAGERNTVIMLFHDSADKTLTAKALPDVIKFFKEKGFSFLSL